MGCVPEPLLTGYMGVLAILALVGFAMAVWLAERAARERHLRDQRAIEEAARDASWHSPMVEPIPAFYQCPAGHRYEKYHRGSCPVCERLAARRPRPAPTPETPEQREARRAEKQRRLEAKRDRHETAERERQMAREQCVMMGGAR